MMVQFNILVFSAILLVQYSVAEMNIPILDEKDNTPLPLQTYTYYGIRNIKTISNMKVDGSNSLTKTHSQFDLIDNNFWLYFVQDNSNRYKVYYHSSTGNDQLLPFEIGFTKYFIDGSQSSYYYIKRYDNQGVCWFGDVAVNGLDCRNQNTVWKDDIFQWNFILAMDLANQYYNINANMSEPIFTKPLEDVLKQHKRVDILSTQNIENCSPTTVTTEVTSEKEVKTSYSLTLSTSETSYSKFCSKFSINFEVGAKVFGVVEAKLQTGLELSFEIGKEYKKERSETWTTEKTTKETSKATIVAPAQSCTIATKTLSWVNNLPAPYKANITVDFKSKDNKLLDKVVADKIAKFYFVNQDVKLSDKGVTVYQITGELRGTFGEDLRIKTNSINSTCHCPDYFDSGNGTFELWRFY